MNLAPDIAAWLGDAAADLTDEQIDRLTALFDATARRWPDPDDAETRQGVLTGGVQVILGDDTLEDIAAEWHDAKQTERERMAALTGALMTTPGSERELCSRTRVARMTVRKALGR